MRETSVYRTASGMIFRVSQGGEEHRVVETLEETGWTKAQPGVVGLRISATTTELTAKQILALPT